jgi:hypothetical protein
MKTSVSRRLFALASALILSLSIATSWAGKPDTKVPSKPEEYDGDRPTDYKYPIKDGSTGGVPHYHVTICEGTTLGWNPWGSGHKPNEPQSDQSKNRDTTPSAKSGKSHAAVSSAGGTDGEIAIEGRTEGSTECTATLKGDDGTVQTIVILVHVVKCTNANKGHRGLALGPPGFRGGTPLATLLQQGAVSVDNVGTGETIGHIADLKIQNLTDQPLQCFVPPMVLESRSGKNQDYVCPKGETVDIGPHSTVTVPQNGVCVNRSKPPVGNGVPGDLGLNTGDSDIPRNPDSHLSSKDADKLLRICTSKYNAADKLEKEGKLNDLPYRDPEKRKDIVVQWSTWSDPRISEITGAPPATKDDMKKVVHKQVTEQGPMTPDKEKKVDQGIDTIFAKVELTTEKAKDLEEPENEGVPPTTAENVSNDTPTPQPQTQEKKQKKEKKKKKKYPQPIQDWLDKSNAADDANRDKQFAQQIYTREKKKCFDKNKHHEELEKKIKDIQGTLGSPLNSNTPEQNDKLIKERDDAKKELDQLEKTLEKDFQQTDDGKKAFKDYSDAEQKAKAADDAASQAEKKLPPGVDKDAIKEADALEKEALKAKW